MLIVNAVTETTKRGEKATPEFVWKMVEEYKMNFPQIIDPDKSFYKYANSSSVSLPFQVAIDLRTMTIVGTKKGASSTIVQDIEKLAQQTLGSQ